MDAQAGGAQDSKAEIHVQLRVVRFFSSSGFSTELLCPPAAAMSAWTAASQEKVNRAAGT